MKKDKPFPFSPMMVAAIRADRKWLTRRKVSDKDIAEMTRLGLAPDGEDMQLWAPYQPGDICYITEEHYVFGFWRKNGKKRPSGHEQWEFVPHNDSSDAVYFSDMLPAHALNFYKSMDKEFPSMLHTYKRLGRYMPRRYARMRIEIISVRGERLDDITHEDALAEGIAPACKDGNITKYGIPDRDGQPGGCDVGWPWSEYMYTPVAAFMKLWEKINGPKSVAANPWVWVYEFKVIEGEA